ncbi:protein translocase subunit SecD [Brachybacterium sp. EF45031]|uniref:protein translocase subunit SecD n=1 Tax=Brachybacterium sillae TaxID=2810536 RepID=UPI00217E39CA|nr:protein translocase subunit SecD [Brachybacterium sillae]MCS6712724.1 protein translocase subunit SecD [Brachybacterium sillae]
MPARRIALAALAVLLLALGVGIGAGTRWGGWSPAPALALDLEGGTQVILHASSLDGRPVGRDAMDQARQIMAQRINAMGVAETEISVQGGDNIVVSVPGQMDQQTSAALRQTAAMSFRPVLAQMAPEGSSDAGGAPSDSAPDPSQQQFSGPVAPNPQADPAAPAASDGGGGSGGLPYPAWSDQWITPEVERQALAADCTDPRSVQEAAAGTPATEPMVVCDAAGTAKFVLGPEVVAGSEIRSADIGAESSPTGQPTGAFAVNMRFQESAAQDFAQMTSALYNQQGVTQSFAIVLDDQVISAPFVQEPSPGGEASITGNFSQETAQTLADQISFGALPLQFEVQSEQQISATLGTDQLEKGLLAGLIGLALVVVYALVQYRVLGLVTTASLIVMAALAYGVITVMSNLPEFGYRLSLAGVTGLIVSIAFTADSFIVYFERVRDEIRDGRGIVSAVDRGWERARRTIVASDAVNLIAAGVLYALSTGGVRGFAFTLGLATILDLLVVVLFTHPLLRSLVETRFFGKGHPWSGLDPAQLDRDVPAYAGRGRVRTPQERGRRGRAEVPAESLAARKARLAAEQGETRPDDPTGGEEAR